MDGAAGNLPRPRFDFFTLATNNHRLRERPLVAWDGYLRMRGNR
ncbi:MAG TPA: hypothetical protein VJN94_15450 [Candidatus Binataceae bacterium]|nr:hypothetical protein [Candidatus Binataceae bacterium]